MITNISAVNKDGIRMSIAEYDLQKKLLRVSYSKSRLDMNMKAAQIQENTVTASDTINLNPQEKKPLGQVLQVKYFEIPEDAETVIFVDREFDNRYQTDAKTFRESYDANLNMFKVDLNTLKRTR
jgi:hypothetical protein